MESRFSRPDQPPAPTGSRCKASQEPTSIRQASARGSKEGPQGRWTKEPRQHRCRPHRTNYPIQMPQTSLHTMSKGASRPTPCWPRRCGTNRSQGARPGGLNALRHAPVHRQHPSILHRGHRPVLAKRLHQVFQMLQAFKEDGVRLFRAHTLPYRRHRSK